MREREREVEKRSWSWIWIFKQKGQSMCTKSECGYYEREECPERARMIHQHICQVCEQTVLPQHVLKREGIPKNRWKSVLKH